MVDLHLRTLEAVIENIYTGNRKITPKLLLDSWDKNTSSYDILKVLCAYINAQKKAGEKADVLQLAENEIIIDNYKKENDVLRQQKSADMNEILECKKRELNLRDELNRSQLQMLNMTKQIETCREKLRSLGFTEDKI